MAVQDEILRLRFQAEGQSAIRSLKDQLRQLEAQGRGLAASFQRGAIDQKQFAVQSEALAQQLARTRGELAGFQSATRGVGFGGQRAAQGLTQFTYIMDDAAYGARALRNQVAPLATALLGFGPAGAAVGAAGTILVGAFSGVIDQGLAAVGILDENLVKGMNKGEEATRAMADAVDTLGARLKNLPAAAQEAGQKLGAAFQGQGAEGRGRVVQQLIAEGFDPNAAEREEVEGRIGRGEALRDRLGPLDFLSRRSIEATISADRDRLVELRREREEAAGKAVEDLIARTAAGDADAGAQFSALARRAGQADLAAEIDRQRGMPGPEIAQVGPTRREMEEGLRREAEIKALADAADKAEAEAREISVADAFAGIIGLEGRVDEGLRDRIGGMMAAGMSAEDARAAAGGTVAESLAAELQESGGLPEEWAREEAERFVRERGKALRAQAAGEALDPASLELERIGMMRAQLAYAEGELSPRGTPQTLGLESFAQAVQSAGAKSPNELLKEGLDKQEALIKINQDIHRVLERGGLLGA